jgi:hypothetical protein
MKKNRIYFIFMILAASIVVHCATPRQSEWVYREDLSKPPVSEGKPFSMIFLGSTGGNRILTTNSSRFGFFRIYKKTNKGFELINPTRKGSKQSFSPDVYIWVHEGFTSYAEYKLVAIDSEGKEYEFPTLVFTPIMKSE